MRFSISRRASGPEKHFFISLFLLVVDRFSYKKPNVFDNLEKCKMFWFSPQLKVEVLIINCALKVVLLFEPENSVLRKLRETNACYGMKSAKTSIFQQHGNYFVYTDDTYIFKMNNNISTKRIRLYIQCWFKILNTQHLKYSCK